MNRGDIVQKLIDSKGYKSYLEIGVANGINFSRIKAPYKIGVDPIAPSQNVVAALDVNCFYHSTTSDRFFESFNGKLDIIFIDGLHTYEQSLRDVINGLKNLNERGTIVIHDCKPSDELVGSTYEDWKARGFGGDWTGDVWKTIVHIRSHYKDINAFVLDCDWGCGIITKGNPESTLEYTSEQIKNMTYFDLAENTTNFLNLKNPSYIDDFINSIE